MARQIDDLRIGVSGQDAACRLYARIRALHLYVHQDDVDRTGFERLDRLLSCGDRRDYVEPPCLPEQLLELLPDGLVVLCYHQRVHQSSPEYGTPSLGRRIMNELPPPSTPSYLIEPRWLLTTFLEKYIPMPQFWLLDLLV